MIYLVENVCMYPEDRSILGTSTSLTAAVAFAERVMADEREGGWHRDGLVVYRHVDVADIEGDLFAEEHREVEVYRTKTGYTGEG